MSTHATIKVAAGTRGGVALHIRADGYPERVIPEVNGFWRNLSDEVRADEVPGRIAQLLVDHWNRDENLDSRCGRIAPLASFGEYGGSYDYRLDTTTGKLWVEVGGRWAMLAELDTEPEVKPWEPEPIHTIKTRYATVSL